MYAARVAIVGSPAASPPAEVDLLRHLRDHLTVPLEHVHVRFADQLIDITLFLDARNQNQADLAATAACARVVQHLDGWHLDS